MSAAKTVSGARALVYIGDLNNNSSTLVGIFNSISYDVTFDVQPVYILGRLSPVETVYTSSAPITIRASAWRTVDHGPHVDARVPVLGDLINADYITISIHDRASGKTIATMKEVRPTGYTQSMVSRQLEEMTLNFVGILMDDESASNAEPADSAKLP